ncbi:MMPL family transporter [Shewanella aquimarina]|uniref:MMPL family transporter n=1 Tax=Shewanella aquimarina TaxID=260365 RepID=UPI002014FD7C|nr:MMPL family transporter [Shewanella aquimarina]MCL2911456.1 MMPL family transporter [Shewanella aquimarina]
MILRLSDCLGRLSANTRLLIWVALLAAMTLLAVQALSRGATVQSDILAMLPKIQEDPLTQRAIDRVEQQLANRIYLGVVSPDQASAVSGAKALLASLQAAPEAFTQVQSADMQGAQALNRFYFPYRFHLLTAQQRALLESGQLAKLEANTLAQLYNAFGYANSQLLSQDPLLLYPELLKQLSPQRRLKVVDGILVGQEATPGPDGQKRSVAIVMAQGVGSAFNPKAQELQLARLEESIAQMQQNLGTEQNVNVLRGGALFHAAAATTQAKREVSSLGLASLVGVILLVWLAFRSIMPLTIAALTIATSLLFALGATLWIFTQVHLLTLVFGTSLIGIAIDYSFHFYCERLQAQKDDASESTNGETNSAANTATYTATSAVARVFPAASLALLTTVIAYLAIGLTPFPGMQQVAVFCAAGLLGAYLTLIFAYPKLANSAMTPGERALGLAARYLNAMQIIARPINGAKGIALALSLLLVTVMGLNRLEVNDDIRALQQSPLSVTQSEERLRQVMSGGTDNQFILVRADTPEALLTRLEALTPTLNSLQHQGMLGNSVNLARYLPSQTSQQEAYRLQGQIYQELPQVLARLGLDSELAPALMASFEASATETITPANFFADKAGELFAPLWLAPELSSKLSPELSHGLSRGTDAQTQIKRSDSDAYGAIVLLGGIKNLGTLTQAISSLSGVTLVDKVQDISDVMAKYRSTTLSLLGLALVVAGLIFSLRFGLKMALWITAVPALAALLTLAGLGLAGSPLTLFHALALILVFGIGVDYSLFFAESHRGEGVMMAVFMSACSTLMAFGLLAFSQTPAIHYFGLTLLLGIGLTFLLSPFIHTLTRIDK